MATIIGYGEDALTYWALSTRLGWILDKLKDPSDPEDCLVLYRPSFGRRGGPNSAQFGEFDAILATPMCVYLIESKWGGSSELKGGIITLRPEQTLRHEIFKWYLKTWTPDTPWKMFLERNVDKGLEGKSIAPARSKLAKNLEHILRLLHGRFPHADVQNVLLYFYKGGQKVPVSVEPESFRLVNCRYETLDGVEYFKMG